MQNLIKIRPLITEIHVFSMYHFFNFFTKQPRFQNNDVIIFLEIV